MIIFVHLKTLRFDLPVEQGDFQALDKEIC